MPRMLLALALVVGVSISSRAEEHPVVAAVIKKMGDAPQDKPFTMLVALKVKSGKEKAFEAAFQDALVNTRKEPGNLAYDLNRHANGSIYIVYERWKNVDALRKHMATDHLVKLGAMLGDFIEGEPDVEVLFPVGEK